MSLSSSESDRSASILLTYYLGACFFYYDKLTSVMVAFIIAPFDQVFLVSLCIVNESCLTQSTNFLHFC